jgi:hypothetical protein
VRDENRTADRPAEIVIAEWRTIRDRVLLFVAPVIRVEHIVAEKLVQSAVKLGGSRAGDDVDLATGTASIFGVVVAAQHFELVDCVDAGIVQQREIAAAVHIVRTVN